MNFERIVVFRGFHSIPRILTELWSEKFEWFDPSPIEPFNLGFSGSGSASGARATWVRPGSTTRPSGRWRRDTAPWWSWARRRTRVSACCTTATTTPRSSSRRREYPSRTCRHDAFFESSFLRFYFLLFRSKPTSTTRTNYFTRDGASPYCILMIVVDIHSDQQEGHACQVNLSRK